MDSLFGIIAIIVIVVLSLKSDKKKKQAARQTPPAGSRASVPKMSAQDAAQVFMNALTNAPDDEEEEEPDLVEPEVDIESDLVEPKVDIACDLAEPTAAPVQAKLSAIQGESVQDADGCIGGSLGAHEEEGESRAEHAHHLARAERANEARNPQPRRVSRAELRRAVIAKEILDRPVSLRNHH